MSLSSDRGGHSSPAGRTSQVQQGVLSVLKSRYNETRGTRCVRASCLPSRTASSSTSASAFESQDASGEMMNMTSVETALVALGGNTAVTPTATPTSSSSSTNSSNPTTDLGEGPVADLPELPAEIWAIIWLLVAAQSGFVGARRLMGDAICKAATEGWGLWCFGLQFFFRFLIFSDKFRPFLHPKINQL